MFTTRPEITGTFGVAATTHWLGTAAAMAVLERGGNAFDAGVASALGKSLIVLQQPDHDHALKEVDAAALAVARDPAQVVQILRYVLTGELPS